jgi:hypothetical protein
MTTMLGAATMLVATVITAAPSDGSGLLDRRLEMRGVLLALDDTPRPTSPDLRVRFGRLLASSAAPASDQGAPADEDRDETGARQPAPGAKPPPTSLDFDLLGAPKQEQPVDEGALRQRRRLLTWHQGVGLGMFALQLATTVVGQLNYDDKFGGDNSGKYVQAHSLLAFSTLVTFAAAGTLALLAPAPIHRDEGFDRVTLHKIAMAVATAGMVAQGVLGVYTQSREGYLNQQTFGKVHLAIGYATLAAVATGVAALVF